MTRATPSLDALYLAFPTGAVTYDCEGCGACCRNIELTTLRVHDCTRAPPAFLSARQSPNAISWHVYADGCPEFGSDGRCMLHARHGVAQKPLSCQLFPFVRLLEIEGFFALLPDARCPWRAAPQSSLHSDHEALRASLPEWIANSPPITSLEPLTSMTPASRRALEEHLCDAAWRSEAPADIVLREQGELQRDLHGPIIKAPKLDIWLDLLRSAGEPPPLSSANRRLFLAALPMLRLLLTDTLPLATIPVALGAFELWLRTLSELGDRELTGSDLVHLFLRTRDLTRVLACAALVPPWNTSKVAPVLEQARQVVSAPDDMPLGEMLLKFLRDEQSGTVCFLSQLGSTMTSW